MTQTPIASALFLVFLSLIPVSLVQAANSSPTSPSTSGSTATGSNSKSNSTSTSSSTSGSISTPSAASPTATTSPTLPNSPSSTSTSTTTVPGSSITPPQAPIIVPAQPPTPATSPSLSNPTPSSTPSTPNASKPNSGTTGTSSSIIPPSPTVQVGQYEKQKAIQEFVRQAADYVLSSGKNTAFKEFNRTDGAFTKDTLYIFAIDYQGNVLAEPYTEEVRKITGNNQINYKDPDGVPVNQLLIQRAKAGGGWIKYKWENPVTKKMECKNTYSMPGDGDFLIASGYYYPPLPNGKCE